MTTRPLIVPRSSADDSSPSSSLVDPQVLNDLAVALMDSDFHDTYLIASDDIQVPACRFVLAARSSVLKKMLYGNFREAKSSSICMVGYDSRTLQAIVEYCSTNRLALSLLLDSNEAGDENSTCSRAATAMEQLVQVYNAADFLDLTGLTSLVEREIRSGMSKCPPLACLVLNQAVANSRVSQYALQMIEVRPYVALDSTTTSGHDGGGSKGVGVGGVECLQADWLLHIMRSQSIAAGEFFLFYMLTRWYEHHSDSDLDAAYQCAKHIQFHNIEPQILLDDALQKKCPWMNPTWIFDAVAKQALRASQDRVWSVQCRGGGGSRESSTSTSAKSRILVEGAGNPNANGIYYLSISGLTRGGDLYSKREIMVGQEYVYTLSCRFVTQTDEDAADQSCGNAAIAATKTTMDESAMVECRIFCNKLLSHAAVPALYDIQEFNRIASPHPIFQPILQILSVEAPPPSTTTGPTSLHDTFYRVTVSDGDWIMPGTLAPSAHIQELCQRGDLVENSIVQVLDFGLYLTNGGSSQGGDASNTYCCLHIQKVSIVNANPGQAFGSPRPLAYQPGKNSNTNETITGNDNNGIGNMTAIHNLYVCTYPLDRQAKDTKIPRTGWLVAEHGQGPAPTCTWIPGVARRDNTVASGAASTTTAASALGTSCSSDVSDARAARTSPNIADDSTRTQA